MFSRLALGLFLYTSLAFSLAHGNAKDTIAYIEKLVASGRKVAILLIDMQTEFLNPMEEREKTRVFSEQLQIFDHFMNNENVHYIDINIEGGGTTVSTLRETLIRKALYRLYIKETSGAFESELKLFSSNTTGKIIEEKLAPALKKQGVTDVITIGCYDC